MHSIGIFSPFSLLHLLHRDYTSVFEGPISGHPVQPENSTQREDLWAPLLWLVILIYMQIMTLYMFVDGIFAEDIYNVFFRFHFCYVRTET